MIRSYCHSWQLRRPIGKASWQGAYARGYTYPVMAPYDSGLQLSVPLMHVSPSPGSARAVLCFKSFPAVIHNSSTPVITAVPEDRPRSGVPVRVYSLPLTVGSRFSDWVTLGPPGPACCLVLHRFAIQSPVLVRVLHPVKGGLQLLFASLWEVLCA